jgi:hypothetical protein
MTAEESDYEPKLTVKLQSETTEPEPFEYTVLKPAETVVEPEDEESTVEMDTEQITIPPEDEEETFEETIEIVDIPKVQEVKSQREKTKKSKGMASPTEPRSISRLQSEIRKHSDARKKTDSAILNIRKELKDLLLIHHASIKVLQKQVTQMHKKILTIENSRKSTKVKKSAKKRPTGKKIPSGKKTSTKKKSKKTSSQKRSKKR